MLTLYEEERIDDVKKISIRYDNPTRTYYVFYYLTHNSSSELILSYNLDEKYWTVETYEHKKLFENNLNSLFHDKNLPFEKQIQYITDYLDNHIANQSQVKNKKINTNHLYTYSSSWLQHFRGMRRWASQDTVKQSSAVLQRYSAPEKSTTMKNDVEIISVKKLAESYYTDEFHRNRTKTFTTLIQYSNELNQKQKSKTALPITELWLNVITKQMSSFQNKLGSYIEEEKLKNLAEKFVTYFSGTLQCNVGHQYQLEFDNQTWHFTVIKVEFFTKKNSEATKISKTKLIFLIDGIPHYVRG